MSMRRLRNRRSLGFAETNLNADGSIMNRKEIIEHRVRRGQCQTCVNEPVQCFVIKKHKYNPLWQTKVPLTVEGLVHEGICLICYPDMDPQKEAKHKKRKKRRVRHRGGMGEVTSSVSAYDESLPSIEPSNDPDSHYTSTPPFSPQQKKASLPTPSSNDRVGLETANKESVSGDDAPNIVDLKYIVNALLDSGDVAAIEVLATAMLESPHDSTLQEYGITTLWMLAQSNDENNDLIIYSSALDAIVEAMDTHISLPVVQERGCCALWSLAVKAEHRSLIANAGGCDRIVAALREHINLENVVAMAVRSLKVLSTDNKVTEVLTTQGCAKAVAQAMGVQSSSPDIAQEGCALLSNMAVDIVNNQVAVASPEEIDAILDAMEAHPDSREVQSNACLTLKNYTFLDENVETMRHVPNIRTLLESATARFPDPCKTNACIVLDRLMESNKEAEARAHREAAHISGDERMAQQGVMSEGVERMETTRSEEGRDQLDRKSGRDTEVIQHSNGLGQYEDWKEKQGCVSPLDGKAARINPGYPDHGEEKMSVTEEIAAEERMAEGLEFREDRKKAPRKSELKEALANLSVGDVFATQQESVSPLYQPLPPFQPSTDVGDSEMPSGTTPEISSPDPLKTAHASSPIAKSVATARETENELNDFDDTEWRSLPPKPRTMPDRLETRVRENDPTLTEINLHGLHGTKLQTEELVSLAAALCRNSTVTYVDLRCNNIGVEGSAAIANAIGQNNTITVIDLSWNDMGDAGAKAIAEALCQNSTVTDVNLKSNRIGDEGGEAFAECLRVNRTVTKLMLGDGNTISNHLRSRIFRLVEINAAGPLDAARMKEKGTGPATKSIDDVGGRTMRNIVETPSKKAARSLDSEEKETNERDQTEEQPEPPAEHGGTDSSELPAVKKEVSERQNHNVLDKRTCAEKDRTQEEEEFVCLANDTVDITPPQVPDALVSPDPPPVPSNARPDQDFPVPAAQQDTPEPRGQTNTTASPATDDQKAAAATPPHESAKNTTPPIEYEEERAGPAGNEGRTDTGTVMKEQHAIKNMKNKPSVNIEPQSQFRETDNEQQEVQSSEAWRLDRSEDTEESSQKNSERQRRLESMYSVGVAYLRRQENNEALECFTDVLRMLRSTDYERSNHEMIEEVLESMACAYGRKKQVDGVIECYEERLSVMRNRVGHEHPQVATLLHTLGKVLVRMGAFERAMDYFDQALAMKKKVFGSDHNEIALTLNNMGASLCKLKMYDDAVEVCTEALRISRVEPQDHAQETMALNILGSTFKNRSWYDQSIKYYEEALRCQKSNSGSDDRLIAVTLRNLGDTYFLTANVDDAISAYTDALSIREGASGKDPDLLRILGKLHKEKGTASESVSEQKETFLQSIQYFEKLYALELKDDRKKHSVFSTLSSLGEVYSLLELHYKSLGFYKSALKALKSSKGGLKKYPDAVVATLLQMGLMYLNLDDPDGALICFQEALRVRRENAAYNGDNPFHRLLQKRGEAYMMKLDYDNALKDFEEALSLVPKNKHEDRLDIQHSIATVFHKIGDLEGAIERYEEVLQERKQLVGEAHPLCGKTLNDIGSVRFTEKKYETAKDLYLSALEILRAAKLQKNHPYVREIIDNITQVDRALLVQRSFFRFGRDSIRWG